MNVFKVSMTEVLEKIHEPLILDRLIRLKLNFQPFLPFKSKVNGPRGEKDGSNDGKLTAMPKTFGSDQT